MSSDEGKVRDVVAAMSVEDRIAQSSRATEQENAVRLEITYKSRGRSGRVWQVVFDLGSDNENAMAAIQYALSHNASIVR